MSSRTRLGELRSVVSDRLDRWAPWPARSVAIGVPVVVGCLVVALVWPSSKPGLGMSPAFGYAGQVLSDGAERGDATDLLVAAVGELSRHLNEHVLKRPDSGAATVPVQPGVSGIIPISRDGVSRIVTPFQRAKVTSKVSEGIEVRGGVVYVTPSSELPLSMFVTEDGDEAVALNLTLVPSRVPSVHLELKLPDGLIPSGGISQPVLAAAPVDRGPAPVPVSGYAPPPSRFGAAEVFVGVVRSDGGFSQRPSAAYR